MTYKAFVFWSNRTWISSNVCLRLVSWNSKIRCHKCQCNFNLELEDWLRLTSYGGTDWVPSFCRRISLMNSNAFSANIFFETRTRLPYQCYQHQRRNITQVLVLASLHDEIEPTSLVRLFCQPPLDTRQVRTISDSPDKYVSIPTTSTTYFRFCLWGKERISLCPKSQPGNGMTDEFPLKWDSF